MGSNERKKQPTMYYTTNICTHCRKTIIETKQRRVCPECRSRMTSAPANLKACPLCNSNKLEVKTHPHSKQAIITCNNCGCSLLQPNIEIAFIVWNTRPKAGEIVKPENYIKIIFVDDEQARSTSTYKIADVINGIY